MAQCDVFVLFDDVQLPLGGHHYETRATIQTRQGPLDLNVPIQNRGAMPLIKDAQLGGGPWKRKHLRSIFQAYGDSEFYRVIESTYQYERESLCALNVVLIREMAIALEIDTPQVLSSQLNVQGQGTGKILGIIKHLGADTYISGTGAGSRRYVDEERFADEGIKLIWHSFEGPNLSAIDKLCRNHSTQQYERQISA